MTKQIGYAVVGLGDVARAVLPAFAHAGETSRLVAIVAGDRAKAQTIAHECRAAAYHYDEFRQCLQREDVNAVFLALPNSMHCEFAVEAARAGVHVLCDKPMAVMADECRRMIRTTQSNRVKLMVSYRLSFHPAHAKAVELVRSGTIGAPQDHQRGLHRRASMIRTIRDCSGAWVAAVSMTSGCRASTPRARCSTASPRRSWP